jgi:NAD(P)-dependent dehydrogenase (short-subunit alcohol dehydrogenase family)
MGDMSDIRFGGQVAVVTGAGGGLGRAYALFLAKRGARVVVNDLGGSPDGGGASVAPATEVVDEIRAAGGEAIADFHDVVSEGEAIVQTALDAWGQVDIVINNAGIAGWGEFHEIPPEDYDRMLDIHYRGTIHVTRRAWASMVDAGCGRVINTSSNTLFGAAGRSHYISAKGAVLGLTRALAQEGKAHGIRVNAIMPVAYTRLVARIPEEALRNWFETNFRPEQVAAFVAWLAHEDIPCTGETFLVGGGRAARVVLAEAAGFAGAESPEDYRDHFEQVMTLDDMTALGSAAEELPFMARQIGAPFDDSSKTS